MIPIHRNILRSYLPHRFLFSFCDFCILAAFADRKILSILQNVHIPSSYIYKRLHMDTRTHKNVRGITMASHCAAKHTTMAVKGEPEKVREERRCVCVFVWRVGHDAFFRQTCKQKKCDGSSRSNKSCKIGQCCFMMPDDFLFILRHIIALPELS